MTEKKKRFSLFRFLLIVLIIFVAIYFVMGLFSGKNTADNSGNNTVDNTTDTTDTTDKDYYSNFYTGSGSSSYSGNWTLSSNVGSLNTSVASGVRAKRTKIIGNNQDVVTIMVYMCGSDLEAQAAMGVYDLQEMATASISPNVNLLVYTGGTNKWHLSGISTNYNQIYRVVGNGQIERLVDNAGSGSMVDPSTLVSFIEWSVDNFQANRYELIFWDHGGGSVSGYGYDLKYPNLGSMDLAKIDRALTEADVAFDFIAFDACLMANTETALMLAEHADYLIASEESEPGIGWYYTDWLNALSKNTSMSTVEIGKNIADSFVRKCKTDTPSQPATLSVIDLAEMQDIIPAKLTAFAKSANAMLNSSQYQTIANARGRAREFGKASSVDLVDLIDMANNIGNDEAKDLITSLLSCIKYNNTTSSMNNSYGLSIYFPYRTNKYVNTVLNTYKNIDMNAEYTNVVRNFASYQTAGQAASGGSHNAYQSFNSYGQAYGNDNNTYDYYYGQQGSGDAIYSLIDLLLGGTDTYSSSSNYETYYADDLFSLLFGRGIDRGMADYIAENHFDADLTWKDGKIALTDKQWSLVSDLKLNVFVDDGSGYIDLGKDNLFDIDENGNLLTISDMTWLAASADNENWQVIPYYYMYEITDGEAQGFYGRVPVRIDGQFANLLIKIDAEGVAEVIGASYDYSREDNGIVAKSLDDIGASNAEFTLVDGKIVENTVEVAAGSTVEFICDFYDYDGNFSDTYVLGDKLTVTDRIYIGDVDISSYKLLATYEVTDIYNQSYWTTPMN